MLLGANLDNVNPVAKHLPSESLFNSLQQQAMLVSMKEIYGWLCILGIFCLILFFLGESSLRPKSLHPTFSRIGHSILRQLKMDIITKED